MVRKDDQTSVVSNNNCCILEYIELFLYNHFIVLLQIVVAVHTIEMFKCNYEQDKLEGHWSYGEKLKNLRINLILDEQVSDTSKCELLLNQQL